jgi:glycosyltransferase involved in cell wall biosynthesis
MTEMHISFILSSLRLSGGVRVVVEYANRLAARGHAVSLVTPAGTMDADVAAEIDEPVRVITSRVPLTEGMSPWHMARLSWSLARAVPRSDIVMSTHTPTTAATLLAARLMGKGRAVWLCQDYAEMFTKRPIEAWLFGKACQWHTATLVVSSFTKNELEAYAPSARIVVVGEGLSHYETLTTTRGNGPATAPDNLTILTMGDMRPRKGMFDFQRAVKLVQQKLADIHVVVFFKEDGHLDVKAPVQTVFRPSRSQLAAMYASCDVFVSASWHESFGLPPLEAMACGAPVVLTDSGGVRDYARDEENCLLAPPRDPEALAAAIVRVLTDPTLAERLRRAGPPTAARFTWEAAVERMEMALSILGSRSS